MKSYNLTACKELLSKQIVCNDKVSALANTETVAYIWVPHYLTTVAQQQRCQDRFSRLFIVVFASSLLYLVVWFCGSFGFIKIITFFTLIKRSQAVIVAHRSTVFCILYPGSWILHPSHKITKRSSEHPRTHLSSQTQTSSPMWAFTFMLIFKTEMNKCLFGSETKPCLFRCFYYCYGNFYSFPII